LTWRGVADTHPDLAQPGADVPGCPGGLGLLGAAHGQEPPVWLAAYVRAADGPERAECGLPGCALLGRVPARLRADRLGRSL
jgi:hypothetical protein